MHKAILITILMSMGHMVWPYQQPQQLTVDPSVRQDLGLSEIARDVQSIPLPAEVIAGGEKSQTEEGIETALVLRSRNA